MVGTAGWQAVKSSGSGAYTAGSSNSLLSLPLACFASRRKRNALLAAARARPTCPSSAIYRCGWMGRAESTITERRAAMKRCPMAGSSAPLATVHTTFQRAAHLKDGQQVGAFCCHIVVTAAGQAGIVQRVHAKGAPVCAATVEHSVLEVADANHPRIEAAACNGVSTAGRLNPASGEWRQIEGWQMRARGACGSRSCCLAPLLMQPHPRPLA